MQFAAYLDPKEVEEIHTASLEILEKVGVLVRNEKARSIYAHHGCKIDKAYHLIHIIRIETSGGTEPAAYGDAFLYGQTGKSLRNLKGPGNTGFGNTIGWQACNFATLKYDGTLVFVKTGDKVVYRRFTGAIGPGNTEDLPLLHLKTQIVHRFELTEFFRNINRLEYHTPLRLFQDLLQSQRIRCHIHNESLIANL